MALEVGQKLWFVPSRRYANPHWLTVTKVGRKWAETDERRIRLDIATLQADSGGYISPGHAYFTESEWEDKRRVEAKWMELRRSISNNWAVPKHLSEADIDAIITLLSPTHNQ